MERIFPAAAAPFASGHPHGLPANRDKASPAAVEAASPAEKGDQETGRRLATSPSEELRAALEKPGDHVAPPTIMQLRIAAMREAPGSSPDGTETPEPAPPDTTARTAAAGYAAADPSSTA